MTNWRQDEFSHGLALGLIHLFPPRDAGEERGAGKI